MEPGFEITVDRGRRRVHERWWGLWTKDTLERYLAEWRATERDMGTRNAYRTLTDLRELVVQVRDLADQLADYLALTPATSERTAIVVSSALLKLQAIRVAQAGHRKFFDDLADAEAWLEED